MGQQVITEKLNTLLNNSREGINQIEINFTDSTAPSFEIITNSRTRFSIENGKLLSDAPDAEVMNIIDAFYKFSKNTLIREWNQNRPEGTHAIEQVKFDLDIPTTQTLEIKYVKEYNMQPVYEIEYRFDPENQIIKLYFILHFGTSEPIKINYRSIIILLNNSGPVSDTTVRKLIKQLHADILNDAVFFAITSNHARLDLVLFKKFLKENKPLITMSHDMDLNEFLPVYDRPYTTKRNVPV